ncbi:MAG TPA: hypothetical protein VGZ73_00815 [Bryobacteraceae bacterium]|nr:hypothetical protein [Bryobacteraceae bacterium]
MKQFLAPAIDSDWLQTPKLGSGDCSFDTLATAFASRNTRRMIRQRVIVPAEN